jgi:hypothetical protein
MSDGPTQQDRRAVPSGGPLFQDSRPTQLDTNVGYGPLNKLRRKWRCYLAGSSGSFRPELRLVITSHGQTRTRRITVGRLTSVSPLTVVQPDRDSPEISGRCMATHEVK